MLKIKTWCLPKLPQKKLNLLHQRIVDAVVRIPELGVKDENDMLNLFPADLMNYGLGTEIAVEINGLPEKPEFSEDVCKNLTRGVGLVVKGMFPKANVESEICQAGYSPSRWSSKEELCQ